MSHKGQPDSENLEPNNKKKNMNLKSDNGEEGWDSALNFLKIQNEKTMKFKENWKKEKNSLKVSRNN